MDLLGPKTSLLRIGLLCSLITNTLGISSETASAESRSGRGPASSSSSGSSGSSSGSASLLPGPPIQQVVYDCMRQTKSDRQACEAAVDRRASISGYKPPEDFMRDGQCYRQTSNGELPCDIAESHNNSLNKVDSDLAEWDQPVPELYSADEVTNNCLADFPGQQRYCACLGQHYKTPENCDGERNRDLYSDAACELPGGKMGKRNAGGACVAESEPAPLCQEKVLAARDACNSNSGSWLQNLQQSASMMGGTLNQMNPSMCGGIAAAQTSAQSGIATYQVMCQNAVQACTQECSGRPEFQSQLAECGKFRQQAAAAQQEVAKAMLTLKGSVQACQNAFGDLNNQAKAHCEANPEACRVDFPSFLGANSAEIPGGAPGGSLGTPGVGGANSSAAARLGWGVDMEDDPRAALAGNGSNANAPGNGGVGGPPVEGGNAPQVGGSAGGNSGPGGRGNGKAGGGLLTNILSGFFGTGGGSGGAGGFMRRLLGLGGSSADRGDYNGEKPKGPDLRQFLPGGLKDPSRNRGIAGQYIGRDGMTGPHSNIWKNVSNRYQYKRASLLP